MSALSADARGVRVALRVMPRAQPAGLAGERDGRLVVRLGAAPVDGEANRALVRLLADRCGLARGAVELVSGQRARNKVALLVGLSREEAAARLEIAP